MKNVKEDMVDLRNALSIFPLKLKSKSFLNSIEWCSNNKEMKKCVEVDGITGQLGDDLLG